MLYDINRKVIANVHAGWRGTFKKIIENAVIKMINDYNCNPNDIIACFCPSIRQCNFEVEEDVKNECEEIFSYTGKLEEIIKLGRVEENKQKELLEAAYEFVKTKQIQSIRVSTRPDYIDKEKLKFPQDLRQRCIYGWSWQFKTHI